MGATLSESIVEHIITNLFFRTVFFSGHNIKQHYRKQIFLDRLVLLCLKNMSETSVFAKFFKKHYRKPTILYCLVWLCSNSMWETNVFAQFLFSGYEYTALSETNALVNKFLFAHFFLNETA